MPALPSPQPAHLDQLLHGADAAARQLRQQDHALNVAVLEQRHVRAHLRNRPHLQAAGSSSSGIGGMFSTIMQASPPRQGCTAAAQAGIRGPARREAGKPASPLLLQLAAAGSGRSTMPHLHHHHLIHLRVLLLIEAAGREAAATRGQVRAGKRAGTQETAAAVPTMISYCRLHWLYLRHNCTVPQGPQRLIGCSFSNAAERRLGQRRRHTRRPSPGHRRCCSAH